MIGISEEKVNHSRWNEGMRMPSFHFRHNDPGSVLDPRQSRLLNALSKVLDEPIARVPARHLESRSTVGLEVSSGQDDKFLWFPGHVAGPEGLVCNRQVIPCCNDHQ